MSIKDNLLNYIQKEGISNYKFMDMCGISPPTYYKILAGEPVRLQIAKRINAVIGKDLGINTIIHKNAIHVCETPICKRLLQYILSEYKSIYRFLNTVEMSYQTLRKLLNGDTISFSTALKIEKISNGQFLAKDFNLSQSELRNHLK